MAVPLRFHVHREPGDNGIYANINDRCVLVATAVNPEIALIIARDRCAMADFEDYQASTASQTEFVCECGHKHQSTDACGFCQCKRFNPIGYSTPGGDVIVFGSQKGTVN